ncbi:MAG: ABC transporter ATP-binding protein [Burkholderiales bacterium]|nr:ABC transporter ATP-binding protein [Burkholderiales bacterium]
MAVRPHDPILVVEGLRVRLRTPAGVVTAVDDVSFTLGRGEVLALVGESGAGKSVTGRALLGLVDSPAEVAVDRVLLDGAVLPVPTPAALRRLRGNRIAMLLADPGQALNPARRVVDQMIDAIRMHDDVPHASARARAGAGLAKVGITAPDAVLDADPRRLSADVRQRVAMAMALVNDPDVIVADEPTAALDATVAARFLHEMHALTRAARVALLWTTRDLAQAAGFADRVCVLYAGRIVEQGTCEEVLVHPAHPYTQGLLDSLPAHYARGQRLRTIPGMMPSRGELPEGCGFRDRCSFADDACHTVPPLRPIGDAGQTVRCVHPLLSLY